jgi:hypothetical protein
VRHVFFRVGILDMDSDRYFTAHGGGIPATPSHTIALARL